MARSAYWLSAPRFNSEVNLWAKQWAQILKARVREKASGEILQRRTGALYESIRVVGNQYGFTVRGLPYGTALDRGFTRRPYTVVPRIKNFLKFRAKSGDTVFARKVEIPETVFEPKPIFSEAWKELLPRMSADLQKRMGEMAGNEVREVIQGNTRRFELNVSL